MDLVHRSHGIHETLLHEVCMRTGTYAAAGVEVNLTDGIGARWRECAAADDAATIAVGGVIAEWLRGDADWTVHFVATSRPLMWVVGRAALGSVAALGGRRVATPPRHHMPSLFLRLVLERFGLDADAVEMVEVHHRPRRRELLLEGEVDAALLGPEGLGLQSQSLVPLAYVGDLVELPTVGLAARGGADRASVAAVTDALGHGLVRLRDDGDLAVACMRALEPEVPEEVARQVWHEVIATGWHGPAWVTAERLGDVPRLAGMLGSAVPSLERLHVFLHGWAARSGTVG